MKRLVAAAIALLAVLSASAFAEGEQKSSPFANDHHFIAPPQ